MALNFAETFLRESGAAQDRSRSMAEMQLRARQFERQMAEQAKQTAIAKMRAQTAEDLAQAQIDAMEVETDLAKSADERAKKLFELQSETENLKLSNEEFREKMLKGEYKDQNAVLSDEDAALYGVPKGTKVKDVRAIQENIINSLQIKANELANERAEQVQDITQAIGQLGQSMQNQPIMDPETIGQYAPPEEQVGLIGNALSQARGFADYLGTYFPITNLGGFISTEGQEAYRQRKDIRQGARAAGTTEKFYEQNIGKTPTDFMSPAEQDLYYNLFMLNQLTNPLQVFRQQGTANLLQSSGIAPFGTDMSPFIPQAPVEGQDD
jgi:hypothetical protein